MLIGHWVLDGVLVPASVNLAGCEAFGLGTSKAVAVVAHLILHQSRVGRRSCSAQARIPTALAISVPRISRRLGRQRANSLQIGSEVEPIKLLAASMARRLARACLAAA